MALAKKIIVDVDVGTDDTLALLILLHAEFEGLVKIECICCTNGNASVENVCKNVIRLLEILGRTDIPVYRGATNQLIQLEDTVNQYHGIDGFGDLEHSEDPDVSIIQSEPAAVGMYDVVAQNPGEVYLICLGPLTNVALALRTFPDFADLVRGIHLMGGNYKAVGNVTKTAEFNFHVDPEAAHIVLGCAKQPVTILPWETCLLTRFSFDWRFNVLGKSEKPVVQLLNRAERSVYKDRTSEHWIPCDAFIAAAFVYPQCISNESLYHATIELHGRDTRGQMVLDHLKANKPNVRVIERVDKDIFQNILLQTVSSNK